MLLNMEVESSSFRDPSGFVFYNKGTCYRQINQVYKENYEFFLESGLYQNLVKEKLLIPHETVEGSHLMFSNGYRTIRPELIPFVSYPYEWCFTQFKNSALATNADAPPPKPLKIATICGICVI